MYMYIDIPIDLIADVKNEVKLDIGISIDMGTTATVDRFDDMCLLDTSESIISNGGLLEGSSNSSIICTCVKRRCGGSSVTTNDSFTY